METKEPCIVNIKFESAYIPYSPPIKLTKEQQDYVNSFKCVSFMCGPILEEVGLITRIKNLWKRKK